MRLPRPANSLAHDPLINTLATRRFFQIAYIDTDTTELVDEATPRTTAR